MLRCTTQAGEELLGECQYVNEWQCFRCIATLNARWLRSGMERREGWETMASKEREEGCGVRLEIAWIGFAGSWACSPSLRTLPREAYHHSGRLQPVRVRLMCGQVYKSAPV